MTTTPKIDKNPFRNYQDSKVARRYEIVDLYLKSLKKSRVSFKYISDLSSQIADHVSKIEESKCDRATFLRSARYKPLLLTYMADMMAPGTKSLSATDIVDPVAKLLLLESEITISNQHNEINRLSAYAAQLETKLAERDPIKSSLLRSPNYSDNSKETLESEHKFIMTCQALKLVINYVQGQFFIDLEKRILTDKLIRHGDNTVVTSNNFSPFVAWLEKTKDRNS